MNTTNKNIIVSDEYISSILKNHSYMSKGRLLPICEYVIARLFIQVKDSKIINTSVFTHVIELNDCKTLKDIKRTAMPIRYARAIKLFKEYLANEK